MWYTVNKYRGGISIETFVGITGGVLGIITFIFPLISDWKIRIIIFFAVIALTFCSLYIIQKRKSSKTIKELDDLKIKHKALSRQFDHKNIQLKKYNAAIYAVDNLMQQSILSTTKDKLSNLYKIFRTIENQLFESEENDNV